jgi:hypothetical protein
MTIVDPEDHDGHADEDRLSPHERRAIRHRERYHGREMPDPPWTVKARIKWLNRDRNRVRALCGFGPTCAASLGEASRPDGINTNAAGYGRALLELETYGPRRGGRSGEWTLTAPKEFPGFERVPDGSFRVIRGRRERAPDGTSVRRWTGRRETPNVLYSGNMPLTERGRPGALASESSGNGSIKGTAGWWAELPAVVACPLCGRMNHCRCGSKGPRQQNVDLATRASAPGSRWNRQCLGGSERRAFYVPGTILDHRRTDIRPRRDGPPRPDRGTCAALAARLRRNRRSRPRGAHQEVPRPGRS